DRYGARTPAAVQDRDRSGRAAVYSDGLGRGLPLRAMRRSLCYAVGVAVAGALATVVGHGTHAGLIVLAILAPVGAVTVALAHQVRRVSGLRRQFAAMAVLIGEQRADYLRRMGTHVNALGSLFDDLFELTRLEAGDIRWGLERVAIAEIVDETVEAMRADADAAVVRVATELPDGTTWARTNPE